MTGGEHTAVRVVVVDPSAIAREGLKRVLERRGRLHVVGEAAGAQSAISVTRAAAPDVVIVDQSLETSDSSLVAQLVGSSPPPRVIVMAEVHAPESVTAAMGNGATGYLLKSARPREVGRAVESLLAGHLYLQPEVTRAFFDAITSRPQTSGVITVTPRELEVLQLLADGNSTEEAAGALDRSPATIKTHMRSVFKKLGARHRAHAVAEAFRLGLIQ